MNTSPAIRLCLGALLLAGFASRAAAEELYGYDLPKVRPDIVRAYQELVPPHLRKYAWLYKLQGTSDPVVTVRVWKEDFLSIWVCKPHDCGDNGVAILSSPDASRVVAEVKMADENDGEPLYLGNPNDAETGVMDERLQ